MDPLKGKFTRIVSRYSEARQLPRLGKIRLGEKVEKLGSNGSTTFPRETPHFVCPPEVQDVYGEKPTELDVILPSDDPEVIFPQKLVMYGSGSGLKCHGNGRVAERYDEKFKVFVQRECPCEFLKTNENPKGACDEKSDLMVILPTVSMGGVYQIKTGSVVSTKNINSALDLTREITGQIAMLPMKLRRVAQQMTHEGKARTHYVLNLILNATWQQVADMRSKRAHASMLIPAQYQIEPPLDEDPDLDPADVQEVDAETIADADEKKLDDIREKLKQGSHGAGGQKPTSIDPLTVTPPAQTSPLSVAAGAPVTGSNSGSPSQEVPPKSRQNRKYTDAEWLDITNHFASSDEMLSLRDTVAKGMGIGSVLRLTDSGRNEFLKRAKEEAGKRGVTIGF